LTKHIFIGVDGGATKCVVRVEDETGSLLGLEVSGPANIRLSADQAWQSIHSALNNIFRPLSLSLADSSCQFHAGMGLAGCEVKEAYQAFLAHPHSLATLIVSSDSHTACLGAHGGQDGAIIIAGTGVVGFQIQQGKTVQVGGFGFPHDDEGGGAWLGLQAVRLTLQWLDGRLPASALASVVYSYFGEDQDQLISFANRANSTQFAVLAPLVIQQAEAGDQMAGAVLQQAAKFIDHIADTLGRQQLVSDKPLPCSLVGGIAPFLEPYLGSALRTRIRDCQLTPDAGAVLMVRQHLKQHKGAA